MLAWTKMIRHGSKNAGMIGLTTAYRVAKLQVGSEARSRSVGCKVSIESPS